MPDLTCQHLRHQLLLSDPPVTEVGAVAPFALNHSLFRQETALLGNLQLSLGHYWPHRQSNDGNKIRLLLLRKSAVVVINSTLQGTCPRCKPLKSASCPAEGRVSAPAYERASLCNSHSGICETSILTTSGGQTILEVHLRELPFHHEQPRTRYLHRSRALLFPSVHYFSHFMLSDHLSAASL